MFLGGFGIDLYEKWAREYEAAHPGVRINLHGHPRMFEKLLPRFAAGMPPDLTWPGSGINYWELAAAGQLATWNKYLEQPGYHPGEKWADAFVPELLAKGTKDGGTYVMPHSAGAFGWWYNSKLFARHGWQPPRTWDELLTLCERIRAAGIAPLTFTGRYPAYLIRGIYFPFVISLGGMEVVDRIQRLEPGAWQHPACVLAAERLMHLKKSGYFQRGCIGMNHTESQMEFLVERAAMIPNGTWLYSEMAKLLPPGFEMVYMNCPVFKDGKGDPTTMLLVIDGQWLLPSRGKHRDIAADFFRFMCTPERRKEYMEKKGTITALKVVGEIEAAPHLREVLRLFREARQTWTYDILDRYPSLSTDLDEATRDLYNEVITPAQFVQRNEESSRRVRENPDTRKFEN